MPRELSDPFVVVQDCLVGGEREMNPTRRRSRGGMVRIVRRGGRSDDPANLRLLCRAHNAIEARRVFGDAVIDAAVVAAKSRRSARSSPAGGP